MNYLVDANVLSEATKPRPQAGVIEWLRKNESRIAVDPIILGEIRFGIYLLPVGGRRRRMKRWFADGVEKIHCVAFQSATGLRWAKLLADLRLSGRSMPVKDSLIAASALTHDLTVVTRNVRDFKAADVKVLNPFDD